MTWITETQHYTIKEISDFSKKNIVLEKFIAKENI